MNATKPRPSWPIIAAIVAVVILANAVGVYFFVGPYLAPHPPIEQLMGLVTCAQCSDPAVQRSIGLAARLGRDLAMAETQPRSLGWWLLLAINIAAPMAAWIAARRRNP